MDLQLTFAPVITSDGYTLIPIALPEITSRVDEIMEHVVAPHELIDLRLDGTEIVATIFLRSKKDLPKTLEEISYFLADDQVMATGIAAPRNINGVGQDIWGQDNLWLDDETLRLLHRSKGSYDLIPILIGYRSISQ